ncbi:hypothetical protein [Sagittula salina]|uniref:DUF3329 domain-containing protein n=1 Tax=Sagittula salina TaxID=2820268 RepID=A0A940MNH2_9RHOB|nr:hypothetical protein [Sagittula salina]MBP0482529.1 hypothetical protein [Sagittula salina]
MARLLDVQHPWFVPLWRRIATVGACLGWATLELSLGNNGWAAMLGLLGLYCAHQFFVAFDPPPDQPEDPEAPRNHTEKDPG